MAFAHPLPDRAPHTDSGAFHAVMTPVSETVRGQPHSVADSPVRTGSIREDVARYNQERGALRPVPRVDGGMQRPPMPSPFRN